jgi:uncharacterized protein
MKRYLEKQILKDLDKKMVFLAGPRQCGKTTVAMNIIDKDKSRYLNWDIEEDKEKILSKTFPVQPGYLVLDEIHKFARWRNLLKGLYDSRKDSLKILVTGSAKLDHYNKGGESLQGRYHFLRLHPLSFKELKKQDQKSLEKLLDLGPFPEPFLGGDKDEARRWSREYRSRLINEELLSLEKVSEISLVDLLSLRLIDSVSSTLSINSLREDLQVSHQTVSRWIELLENLYHVYRIYPFGSPKLKALKKESKLYFLDWNLIKNPYARLENLVANHLLKWCHYLEDTLGYSMELRFYRDLEKREVDFVVLQDSSPIEFIEVKQSKQNIDSNLVYLKKKFPEVPAVQVSLEECKDEFVGDYCIRRVSLSRYLLEKI